MLQSLVPVSRLEMPERERERERETVRSSTLSEKNRFLCCVLLSETYGFHRTHDAEVTPEIKKLSP